MEQHTTRHHVKISLSQNEAKDSTYYINQNMFSQTSEAQTFSKGKHDLVI
jgi:hypothetical protein